MLLNNLYIGNSVFFLKKNNEAEICNLFIKKNFRSNNYGSKLLLNTEYILQNNYNINKSYLLAHELPFGNLVSFYKLNGYNIYNANTKVLDNGENLYTLTYMYKYL